MSVYFSQAEQNIRCECPLCFCPYSLTKFRNHLPKRYSFVYVNNKQDYIYLVIGKNASTTIRNTFFEGNSSSLIDPDKPLHNYFKFTFVRNPWDRMVSNWKMFTTTPERIEQLRSLANRIPQNFEEFVSIALTIDNHHWIPQVQFLIMPVDFIGRVENMDKDIQHVADCIGVSVNNVTHHNASSNQTHYSHHYTPELIERVGNYYAEDIERFGYTFEEL